MQSTDTSISLVSDQNLQEMAAGLMKEPAIWIENYLKISAEQRQATDEDLSDGGPDQMNQKIIPFRLNESQLILYRKMKYYQEMKKPTRLLIPKARKQGITTLIQALFFERLYNNDHEEAAVVAHNAESSSYIFQISRRFYDFLPQDMQRGLKYSAKTELEYIEPHGSKYMVMTARSGDALAKGTTPTLFHGSEVANWADSGQDPWKAWTSIASSIPDHHETAIILESTANGRDPFFYRMCMGAIKGDNDYEVVFLPWYLNDKYTREITDSGWRITQEEDHIKGEILDTEGYLISDEQFEYRRWCIKNKCGGEVGIWDRYYPATLRDAFAVSEKRFFPESVKKHYRESVAPPKVVGDMGISEGGYPVFDPNKHGSLHVWEKPISREKYVIAVDVSEGIPGGDYHSAYVLKRSSIEAVAALSCLVDADELVDQLYRLGLWYNKAVIAPENNHNPEVCRRLSYHMRYPNVYWQRDINNPRSKANRPGWNTNVKTRREMLDVLKMVTRQHLLRIYDEGFVEEMEDFAWNVNTRKWQATPGKHDDRIMAMAIGLMLLDLSPYKDRSDRLRPKVEDGFSRYKEFESYWKKHSGSNKKTGRLTFG